MCVLRSKDSSINLQFMSNDNKLFLILFSSAVYKCFINLFLYVGVNYGLDKKYIVGIVRGKDFESLLSSAKISLEFEMNSDSSSSSICN